VNDEMPGYCAGQIGTWAADTDRDPAATTVAVMGLAFKTNSGDVRLTPVLPLLGALGDQGFRVAVHDPMVLPAEAAHLGVDLVATAEETLRGADCVVFLVGHDEFRALSPARLADLLAPGALVYDGRMYFDHAAIAEMTGRGLVYKGVGR
jgi:UDP-N-acetyl-D-mannosaminuronic acid dehydrogenase